MTHPVVHFEIIGRDPGKLREYYGTLFGWTFAVGGDTAPGVSAEGRYGFTEPGPIPGGIGGGPDHAPRSLFYVGVPDVPAALERAVALGGTRVMGPERTPGGDLVVAHVTDPEGNLIGLAGPAV
ncbi:VOC family protein [Catenuloplanes atrovinosus]|uniref:Enzyme related to lactoylglutathione lyase n=1 Tax=Catenuloplanes atrovinosus TaxID=137266 RepID=A0AAE4CAB0_9ACTN|nr:VOC family protein [Catenuloplanes atrovinosus]MDR7274440.1 putative enzyme related to lactoylglutathione lyase [Catenuloplanes atrovinosus]